MEGRELFDGILLVAGPKLAAARDDPRLAYLLRSPAAQPAGPYIPH